MKNNNIISFISKIIAILNYIKTLFCSKEISPLGYYVYVPYYDKPKYIHSTYESAVIEAKRLRKLFELRKEAVDIQILKIIKEL